MSRSKSDICHAKKVTFVSSKIFKFVVLFNYHLSTKGNLDMKTKLTSQEITSLLISGKPLTIMNMYPDINSHQTIYILSGNQIPETTIYFLLSDLIKLGYQPTDTQLLTSDKLDITSVTYSK